MARSPLLLVCALVLLHGTACEQPPAGPPSLFDRLPAERTGISFSNDLSPSRALNIVNWPYFYNGAGVAAGDVNGDGRVDLYFTSNQESNRLYLNRGNFRFREVTAQAGVSGRADWSNGVTMADVNGDGRLDLYVSVVHGYAGLQGHNELYINQGPDDAGVPQFEERSADYNLDHRGYGVQSLFFDYDGDGDLDVYLLKAAGNRSRTFPRATARTKPAPRVGDRLYRNDDSTFTDVTAEAGIYSGPTGAGLGVAASDLDGNGCPDLYVANDFYEHDYLYYNNCDGTFTEAIQQATRHVSYSSMGVDAADFNNDGRTDVAVADMLPFREGILKTTEPPDSKRIYRIRREYGYHHQLERNTLQLNQGHRHFSEIGLLAGVAATDWSWAPLFADLDNDGRKDLFVTNGIVRRPDNLDYFDYAMTEGRLDSLRAGDTAPYKELRRRMPHDPVPNFAFRNTGDLTFSDSTAAWGLHRPGFSTGAAYADLNNDGALDLVVNNIGAPASIYENRADSLRNHHYLTVRLKGDGDNTHGLGAKVRVYQDGRTQLLEQMPTRGYQSAVPARLHFGLGTRAVDSLRVTWPDGRTQTRAAVRVDTTVTLRQSNATRPSAAPRPASASKSEEDAPSFSVETAEELGIDFRHEENHSFDDFEREPLMPRRLSTEGPALAVGDVDGDGLEDVYLGGAQRQPGALYLQRPDGQFRPSAATDSLWRADRVHEDVDAAFFDANGDGALDLYVVSAGNAFPVGSDALRDRLYLNDGTGTFRRADGALPEAVATQGSVVAPADFDDDGDTDLFVGSRVGAGGYGQSPRSFLLENDGSGRYTDVTETVAPGLRTVGLVTDAVWADVWGGDAPELTVVGEWMPITVFVRQGGRAQGSPRLIERTEAAGLADTEGWWTALRAADLNGDESADLIAGNFGLNTRLRAAPETPVRLYLNDFNGDGEPEPILTRYNEGQSYPWARRDELLKQVPALKKQFPTYAAYGDSQVEDLFSARKIREARVKEARLFASAYLDPRGDSTLAVEPLPARAQFAPVYGILPRDLTGDERREVVLGGNFHGVRPRQGRYDASYGTVLRKTRTGRWTALPPYTSQMYLEGEVRALRLLERPGEGAIVLVARNDARPQVVRLQTSEALQRARPQPSAD